MGVGAVGGGNRGLKTATIIPNYPPNPTPTPTCPEEEKRKSGGSFLGVNDVASLVQPRWGGGVTNLLGGQAHLSRCEDLSGLKAAQ